MMMLLHTAGGAFDETNGLFCGPTTARNLFWNFTRVGDINVQPCPGGATGIAKWRCSGTLLPNAHPKQQRSHGAADGDNQLADAFEPNTGYMWQPSTPDLTQCRSLWLNSLEVRVSSRDSALVSIANDLSQVIASFIRYTVYRLWLCDVCARLFGMRPRYAAFFSRAPRPMYAFSYADVQASTHRHHQFPK